MPIPISAAPEISPAQIGSSPSTQNSLPRVPGSRYLRPMIQKISAPTHIAKVDSGGSTTPRPIDTADSAKLGGIAAVYRQVSDNFEIGVGYNFGRYSDDLADLSADDQGFFVNAMGKL